MASFHEAIGYPLLAAAALELLLGYILLRQNPRHSPVQKAAAAISFFSAAFSFCTAVMYIRASLGLPYNLFARANWIGWFTIPAALQFVLYLKNEQSRIARLAGYLLYPFWSVMLCLSLSTDLIVTGDYVLFPYATRPGPLDSPLRLIGTGLVLWLIVEVLRLRKLVSGDRKAQLNYFFTGMLIFAGGGALLSGILPVLGGFGFEPGLGSSFSLPWVVLAFYAITRYGLFDVRAIISRSLTIILQSLIFSVIQLALFLLLVPTFGPAAAIAISLPLVGFLFFGTRFSRDVERWVSHVVIKGKFDYQQVLQESSKAIVTILDLNELLDYLMKTVRTSLRVRNACLYLKDQAGRYPLRHSIAAPHGSFCRDLLPAVAADQMRAAGRPVIRKELEGARSDGDDDGLIDCLNVIQAEIAVPLLYQGGLQGVLALGRKGNREPYVQGDIDLLDALASHAAIAIENARLYEAARRATASLSESESKFHALAQTVPAAIFIHQGGRIVYTNSAGESLTGYPLGGLLAMKFRDIVHPEYRGALAQTAPAEGTPQRALQDEFKIIRRDGEERWVLMSAGAIEFAGKPAIIGTLFDITERKNLEGKLRYAQKMEALGKLAGGVAHDFNNVLTTIVGYGDLLNGKVDRTGPLREYVDHILASSERAAGLVKSLLSFGARVEAKLTTRDLNEMVLRAERFLAGLLPKNVVFQIRTAPGVIPIHADAGKIERVIMNLVLNARDAMPGGGTLAVETGIRELDAEFVRAHGFGRLGPHAFVAVHDTGTGMDEGVKKRIFEPFFTTKSSGKGTGFGLSIVYDIVKEHEGYITVASEPAKGSSFFIFLPLAQESAASLEPGPVPSRAGGREMVLITDDDETTRKYAAAVLGEYGYRVLQAGDGEEALKKLREEGEGVRLVIMDMTMPRMNGKEASRAIRKMRPDVKVICMSGYNEDLLLKTGILEQGQHFLMKPVSQQELLRAVREVLGS